MKLLFLPATPVHSKPLIRSSITTVSCFYKPYAKSFSVTATSIPPRDRVIHFGKHKGKMLGTLSPKYLRWVSENLRTREFEEWGKLADQVLADEVYKDRIEWEFAERILTGNSASFSKPGGTVADLEELSERFGWDFTDDAGWSKIKFELIGTSKGGRIPRIDPNRKAEVEREAAARREKARASAEEGESSDGRARRRARMRSKRSEGKPRVVVGSGINNANECDEREADNQDRTAEILPKGFPGRVSLLKKVIDYKRFS